VLFCNRKIIFDHFCYRYGSACMLQNTSFMFINTKSCSKIWLCLRNRENDKGLYATMRGGRIDPSSCLDTCWVDDMAVWWFRATCFHGLKYLCVNREVLKTKSLWKQKWKHQTSVCTLPMYSWLVVVWDASELPSLTLLILRQWRTTVLSTWLTVNDTLNLVLWVTLSQSWIPWCTKLPFRIVTCFA